MKTQPRDYDKNLYKVLTTEYDKNQNPNFNRTSNPIISGRTVNYF